MPVPQLAPPPPGPAPPLAVDMISDVICPWCWIGLTGFLAAARQRPQIPITLTLRPYQLDPDVPPGGADHRARLLDRFGGDAGRLRAAGRAVEEAGAAVGLAFAFDRISRTPNTLDCHRLLRWAGGAGVGLEAAQALFAAYFVEGEDLSSRETLLAIGRGLGLDGPVLAGLLDSDADVAQVQHEIAVARRMGIGGVPCFVFDGALAVMGAQSPERFVRAIDTAAAARTPAGPQRPTGPDG